jgi:Rps23 Pro-64 3,4-dihydroxylase Tpa1-like proline 4-hydroxylase
MESKELALGIKLYRKPDNTQHVLDEIEELLNPLSKLQWSPSRVKTSEGYVVDTKFRYNVYFWLNKNLDYSDEDKTRIAKVESLIDAEVKPCLQQYQSDVGVSIEKQEPYELLKYTESNFLEWHTDDGSSDRSRVSMLYYLNDGYEGGELEFANFDVFYKPQRGDVIVFPSSFIYKHRVREVTSGVRYVIADFMAYYEP